MTAGPIAPYRIRPSVVRNGLAGQCGAENGPVVYARLVLASGAARDGGSKSRCGMAGGIGAFIVQKTAGIPFTKTGEMGAAFTFLGFEGKQGGYFIMFCCCGVAYILAWTIMKLLVPKYKPVEM